MCRIILEYLICLMLCILIFFHYLSIVYSLLFYLGNPIPNWVMSIVPDPALDVGFTGTSDGINAINHNCVHRHRRGAFETDGAKWGARKCHVVYNVIFIDISSIY
jgi:hypothetical protein